MNVCFEYNMKPKWIPSKIAINQKMNINRVQVFICLSLTLIAIINVLIKETTSYSFVIQIKLLLSVIKTKFHPAHLTLILPDGSLGGPPPPLPFCVGKMPQVQLRSFRTFCITDIWVLIVRKLDIPLHSAIF